MSARYRAYLRDRYRLLFGYIGSIWFLIALAMLSPLLLIPFYPDEVGHAWAFLLPALPLATVGFVLRRRYADREDTSATVPEGMVVLVIVWVSAILVGALPFMLLSGLNLTQALFESTSGWTTTGLSVVDVTEAPRLILFYRSVLQFVGGAGFAIVMLSLIGGQAGIGLSTAEGRDDQLVPQVRQSANVVLTIYIGYAILGTLALALAGMGWFDAINHAFSAVSTGGFSTRPESIGYWDSPAIEAVIIVLMLLAMFNFLTIYVLVRGKIGAVLRNGEVQLVAYILPFGMALLAAAVGGLYPTLGKDVRVVVFEATSALSTAGFSTVSYADWDDYGLMVLILLMLIGGGSGSTAGGIKQFRIYALIKGLWWELKRPFLPQNAVNKPQIWRGDKRVTLTDTQIRRIAMFVFLYIVVYFIGVTVLVAHGYPLNQSLFEFASVSSTVGLSVGITAPDAPITVLWVQILGMLLGRLEYLAVVIGFSKLVADGLIFFNRGQRSAG